MPCCNDSAQHDSAAVLALHQQKGQHHARRALTLVKVPTSPKTAQCPQAVMALAGALLAVGITNCGVQDECDPAYALLCESVNHDAANVRIGAIMGLGLAYAGTQKAEVQVSQQPCH